MDPRLSFSTWSFWHSGYQVDRCLTVVVPESLLSSDGVKTSGRVEVVNSATFEEKGGVLSYMAEVGDGLRLLPDLEIVNLKVPRYLPPRCCSVRACLVQS